ncbi:MAG TPA: sigma-70 family RNA polymerase sigma factor [Candidatus Brocadiia bacterium]|nr:sigma-70 family RNA polymerase sigma factor [Candidatus Brocadiia bacterium]
MTSPEPTDGQLLMNCRRGDPRSFGLLIERYQDRIYNTALGMLGSPEDAADVAQEVFIKAWRSLAGFRGDSSFLTWVTRITYNTVISHRRKGGIQTQSLWIEDDDSREEKASDNPGVDPADESLSREAQQRVRAAIAALPDDARRLVVLRDIEGMEYEEIADVTGLPLGTVKSRLHRARMQLKETLEPYAAENA